MFSSRQSFLPDHAYIAANSSHIWASASKDYDSLPFGTPRLVRFLTISGKEFLPSQGTFRPIAPEVIELDRLLDGSGISREGLVDLAILVGTDFNEGVKGIGPKKALTLVQKHGRIEHMPGTIRDALGDPDALPLRGARVLARARERRARTHVSRAHPVLAAR